jgi:hypothetical protein
MNTVFALPDALNSTSPLQNGLCKTEIKLVPAQIELPGIENGLGEHQIKLSMAHYDYW